MTATSRCSSSSFNPYSIHSTYAVSVESQQIRQSFNNEWYIAALMQAGYEKLPTITQVYVEPVSEYHYPNPLRSYKIKVCVVSRTKGQPVKYNE